jgi:hypothetical protein
MVNVLHHRTDHIAAGLPSDKCIHACQTTTSIPIAIYCTRFSRVSSALQEWELPTTAKASLRTVVATTTTSSLDAERLNSKLSYEPYATYTPPRVLAAPHEPGQ